MRARRPAALALAAALVLTSCGRKAPEPLPTPAPTPTPAVEARDFVLPWSAAASFHPITGSNKMNLTLAPLVFRGLFALDRQFEARPDLCTGWQVSSDGLTWTFRLAEAAFSDGTPLTAAQVVSSLNTARRSERYAGRLKDISKVTAGEGTVTVTLTRPNGALPALLDVPIVKETADPNRPLGTGPYALSEEGGPALLARGETAPGLEEIQLWPVAAVDDLVYAFDAQEISLVDTDLTGATALGYSGRYETVDYPTTTLLYVGFNLRSDACRDVTLRKAISLALDRQEVARRLLSGHAAASALPIHPYSDLYDGDLAAANKYDPAAAQAMLASAGWTRDEEGRLRKGRSGLSLRLAVNQDNTYKVAVAEALGASLRDLGWDVTVEKLPWDDFIAALTRRSFDLYLGETTLTADFDPEALLSPNGALNYGGCYDETLNSLMEQFRAADGEERRAAASALCARIAEIVPLTPLCFKNGALLTQWGQVRGAMPTQRDVFANFADWTVDLF